MDEHHAERPERQAPRHPWLIAFLAFGVPAIALISIVLLQPFSDFNLFGIRGTVWSLFLCAPLTSLCLLVCNRMLGADETEAGEAE